MSPYLSDPRWSVDWVRLVTNLRASGMSLQEIAAAARVSKSQVVAYGSEELRQRPEHSAGERLIAVWCHMLSYSREDLPMHRHPLSVSKILRASR
ncbi:hypothetical protein [Roseateles sp.]|uniref:hypothetical protein n=1 Tax=Roseateles sp. TaxID=1971397 RepID=UPI00392FA966